MTHVKPNGDKVIQEFTVVKAGPTPYGEDPPFNLEGPWSVELLQRAPLGEPQGIGAIVSFDDPLEGLRHVAVLLGGGMWVDEDAHSWAWKVISENNPLVLREGLGGEP